jgi:hypothetical protein
MKQHDLTPAANACPPGSRANPSGIVYGSETEREIVRLREWIYQMAASSYDPTIKTMGAEALHGRWYNEGRHI